MATKPLAEQLNLNTLLVSSLRDHLPEMPHLAGLHQELEAVLNESRTLEDQKGFYEFQLRKTNARRRELEKQGNELRLRLDLALRGIFGNDSENLLKFGVKPRAVRRRRGETPDALPTL